MVACLEATRKDWEMIVSLQRIMAQKKIHMFQQHCTSLLSPCFLLSETKNNNNPQALTALNLKNFKIARRAYGHLKVNGRSPENIEFL